MKVKTTEAAKRLGLHTVDFVLAVNDMVGSLEDCWPEVDDGYIETLRALGTGVPTQAPPKGNAEIENSDASKAEKNKQSLPVSESAAKILDKLERQDRWGGNVVQRNTLKNHFCRNVPNFENGFEELVKQGFLVNPKANRDSYSLNSERKGDIDRITRLLRSKATIKNRS